MTKKERPRKIPILKSLVILLIFLVIWFVVIETQNNNSNKNNIADTSNPNSQEASISPEQQCQDNGQIWCNNQCYNQCPSGDQSFCPSSGKLNCIPVSSESPNGFQSYENQEPYYSGFCDKINPYDLNVRTASAEAIRKDAGSYSINQLLDIYDWVKNNIQYQNVPLAGIPYSPSDTLTTKSGDCKNQAVLIASMVRAIGGTAKVVVDPSCSHAYALVYISNQSQDVQSIADIIDAHYLQKLIIQYVTIGNQNWLIFDPAGGAYPGNTLADCSGGENNYYVDSCLDCVNQYPTKPYTFNNACYSQCPSGTISTNDHACSPCPQGSYSLNNQCVTCQDGYILGQDGRCHPTCVDSSHYCITGTCVNNQCA